MGVWLRLLFDSPETGQHLGKGWERTRASVISIFRRAVMSGGAPARGGFEPMPWSGRALRAKSSAPRYQIADGSAL